VFQALLDRSEGSLDERPYGVLEHAPRDPTRFPAGQLYGRGLTGGESDLCEFDSKIQLMPVPFTELRIVDGVQHELLQLQVEVEAAERSNSLRGLLHEDTID